MASIVWRRTTSANGKQPKLEREETPASEPTLLCKDELSALCQFMATSVREADPQRLDR